MGCNLKKGFIKDLAVSRGQAGSWAGLCSYCSGFSVECPQSQRQTAGSSDQALGRDRRRHWSWFGFCLPLGAELGFAVEPSLHSTSLSWRVYHPTSSSFPSLLTLSDVTARIQTHASCCWPGTHPVGAGSEQHGSSRVWRACRRSEEQPDPSGKGKPHVHPLFWSGLGLGKVQRG